MLSKSFHWKDFAELVGITAIVASLIFVGLQMRQAQDIAISDGNLANAANKIETNNLIAANPDVWFKGASGEELGESEAVVFRSMVQNVYDVAFFEFLRMRRLGQVEIAAYVVANFSAFLFENPGARQLWSEDVRNNTKLRSLLLPDQSTFSDFDDEVRTDLAVLDKSAH